MLTGIENAASLRTFAYSVLGLITSQSVDGSDAPNYDPHLEQDEDTINNSSKSHTRVNNQNAWCWRDNCPGGNSPFAISAGSNRDRLRFRVPGFDNRPPEDG